MKFVIDIFCPDGPFTEDEIRMALWNLMRGPTHAMRGGFSVKEIKTGMGAQNILDVVNKINWADDMAWSPYEPQHPFVIKKELKQYNSYPPVETVTHVNVFDGRFDSPEFEKALRNHPGVLITKKQSKKIRKVMNRCAPKKKSSKKSKS